METYDVEVPERGGDLNLSLDMNSVQVVDDAFLADRLDRHLEKKRHTIESTLFVQITCIILFFKVVKQSSRAHLPQQENCIKLSGVVAHFYRTSGPRKQIPL